MQLIYQPLRPYIRHGKLFLAFKLRNTDPEDHLIKEKRLLSTTMSVTASFLANTGMQMWTENRRKYDIFKSISYVFTVFFCCLCFLSLIDWLFVVLLHICAVYGQFHGSLQENEFSEMWEGRGRVVANLLENINPCV